MMYELMYQVDGVVRDKLRINHLSPVSSYWDNLKVL